MFEIVHNKCWLVKFDRVYCLQSAVQFLDNNNFAESVRKRLHIRLHVKIIKLMVNDERKISNTRTLYGGTFSKVFICIILCLLLLLLFITTFY